MKLDLSAAELFLAYLAGGVSGDELLQHPAYRAVRAHADRISNHIGSDDIEKALRGEPSQFYGLAHVRERIPEIRALMSTIDASAHPWMAQATASLSHLLPHEELDSITIYPIIGYDMGIGLQETVCINLNWAPYSASPGELLYFIVHEAFHCVYERSHEIPLLAEITSPQQWLSYFYLWSQNEGYATYAPLALRKERGHLQDPLGDYTVLMSEGQLKAHFAAFKETSALIAAGKPNSQEDYLELLFGSRRLPYRAGCGLIMRIERTYGYEAVREAVYLTGEQFISTYGHLLEDAWAPIASRLPREP